MLPRLLLSGIIEYAFRNAAKQPVLGDHGEIK